MTHRRLFTLKTLIVVLSTLSMAIHADTLKPFTTDGCSAFPDGTLTQQTLWQDCCIAHDYAYWKGGTYDERVEADMALQRCVAALGETEIATLMLAGVRVGGSPFWPTDFRWGYGWPFPRGYSGLTEAERQQINRQPPMNLQRLLRDD